MSNYDDYDFYQVRLTADLSTINIDKSQLNTDDLVAVMYSEPVPVCNKSLATTVNTEFSISIPEINILSVNVDQCTNNVYFDLMLKSIVEITDNTQSSNDVVITNGSSENVISDVNVTVSNYSDLQASFATLSSAFVSNIQPLVSEMDDSFNSMVSCNTLLVNAWDSNLTVINNFVSDKNSAVLTTNDNISLINNLLSSIYLFNSVWMNSEQSFSNDVITDFNTSIETALTDNNVLRTNTNILLNDLIQYDNDDNSSTNNNDYTEIIEKHKLQKTFSILTTSGDNVLTVSLNLLNSSVVSSAVRFSSKILKIMRVPQRVLTNDNSSTVAATSGQLLTIDSTELMNYANAVVRNVTPNSLRIVLPRSNKLSTLFPRLFGSTLNAVEDTLQQTVKVSAICSFQPVSFPALLTLDSKNSSIALDINADIISKYSAGGLFNNFTSLVTSSTFMDDLVNLGAFRVNGINRCTTVPLFEFSVLVDPFADLVLNEYNLSIDTLMSSVYSSDVDHGFKIASHNDFKSEFFKQ